MANAKLNGWIRHAIILLIGIAFGAGGALASLNHLSGRVNDHEARIRMVESAFARIDEKLNYLINPDERDD